MNETTERIMFHLHRALLVIRHRPVVACPFCEGKGGEMKGYEEPEWSECSECYQRWRDLEDCGADWFIGRTSLWAWVQGKLSIKAGLWYALPIRTLLKCKLLGIHYWVNEDQSEPGLRICGHCWKDKKVPVGLHEFVHLPGGGMGWMPVGSGNEKVNPNEIYH